MRKIIAVLAALCLLHLGAAAEGPPRVELYGEEHSVAAILDRELEIWQEHYDAGDRDLFLELAYFTGQYLNLWLRAADDEILEAVFDDWYDTAICTEEERAFFLALKARCPETILHGTDVGHQYDTTGARYLALLAAEGKQGTEDYRLTQEAIAQGERFLHSGDMADREQQMTQNLLQALERVSSASVVGFYGSAHTGLDALDSTGTIPCMGAQLKAVLGERLTSTDLSYLALRTAPLRTDAVEVSGKDYPADYFGTEDISDYGWGYETRAFWRLSGAWEDLRGWQETGNVLPLGNYPAQVAVGDIWCIEYVRSDGTKRRELHRAEGTQWRGAEVTCQIEPQAAETEEDAD